MTIDQVFVALLVVLVLLINFVVPILRRAAQESERERVEPVEPAVSVRRRVIPVRPAPHIPQGRQPAPLKIAATTRRRAPQPVTLREARRGIVLMTILGPCRAYDAADGYGLSAASAPTPRPVG
jgi:hypothetical protein